MNIKPSKNESIIISFFTQQDALSASEIFMKMEGARQKKRKETGQEMKTPLTVKLVHGTLDRMVGLGLLHRTADGKYTLK